MEDFTAAMDAVNVDLDEMRARVDSTHSIITSPLDFGRHFGSVWAESFFQLTRVRAVSNGFGRHFGS